MRNFLVIDVETKRHFHEVGGRSGFHLLGAGITGVYDYATKELFALEEAEIGRLEELITQREGVIGFNTLSFDYKVLQPYFHRVDLTTVYSIDLLAEVERACGFRVSLNNLSSATLGRSKSGDGLEALRWFKEGRIEDVKRYCLDDVALTRDLYEYGSAHGYVKMISRTDGERSVVANWAEGMRKDSEVLRVLDEALRTKQRVEIDYVSTRPGNKGEEMRKKRDIEVYAIRGNTIDAYCHLRKDRRQFKLFKILSAELKAEAQMQSQLF